MNLSCPKNERDRNARAPATMIKIYVPKMCVTKLAVPPDDKKKRTRILADGTNVYDEKKKIVIFFLFIVCVVRVVIVSFCVLV